MPVLLLGIIAGFYSITASSQTFDNVDSIITINDIKYNSFKIESLQNLKATAIENFKIDSAFEIQNLNSYKEKKWYSLLPSLGYDFITNRPVISVSASNYISYLNRKNQLQYQRKQIVQKLKIQLQTDTLQLSHLYQALLITIDNSVSQLAHQDSTRKLLHIKIEENKKLQATSEDVLKIKLQQNKEALQVYEYKQQILNLKNQIELKIKREMFLAFPKEFTLKI